MRVHQAARLALLVVLQKVARLVAQAQVLAKVEAQVALLVVQKAVAL